MRKSSAAILFTGGNAAPDVPLRLVHFQNLLDLEVQRPVEQRQPFGDVLMYGGFADAELLCGGPNGGPVLYNVQGQAFGPLLHVTLQNTTLPA